MSADLSDMAEEDPEADLIEASRSARLASEEDDELRRLNQLGQSGGELSWRQRQRFVELRLRDRRQLIQRPAKRGIFRKVLRLGR